MQYVRMRVIGSGLRGDAFRVRFPTYRTVALEHRNGPGKPPTHAVILIRDDDYVAPVGRESETRETVGDIADVVTGIEDSHRKRWRKRLDSRYREHAGEYDLGIE